MTPPRLNPAIDKLVRGEIVITSPPVANGSPEVALAYGDSDFDMVIFEMEHFGFDPVGLRASLQMLLNRGRIARDGLVPSVLPLTRIPPNAREQNQWIIKQALDLGVYGLVTPMIQTPEDALGIVNAARYPARRGSSLGGGQRGYWPTLAARYWGISREEYTQRADVWPLNPDGELLIMGIIESQAGVDNLPQILEATRGIGAIWAGPGDMSADMGLMGQPTHPEVEDNIQRVLATCKSFDIPCAAIAMNAADAMARITQGFQIIMVVDQPGITASIRAHAAKRSTAPKQGFSS